MGTYVHTTVDRGTGEWAGNGWDGWVGGTLGTSHRAPRLGVILGTHENRGLQG